MAPELLSPALMNVHHLELFFYVAKHGGISEAVPPGKALPPPPRL